MQNTFTDEDRELLAGKNFAVVATVGPGGARRRTENPYRCLEIRGSAEVLPDPTRALPRELSQKYLGKEPPPEAPQVQRVIVRVVPERINRHPAG